MVISVVKFVSLLFQLYFHSYLTSGIVIVRRVRGVGVQRGGGARGRSGRGGAAAVVNKHDGGESQSGKGETISPISPSLNLNFSLEPSWRSFVA